jgi:hypothetical protein
MPTQVTNTSKFCLEAIVAHHVKVPNYFNSLYVSLPPDMVSLDEDRCGGPLSAVELKCPVTLQEINAPYYCSITSSKSARYLTTSQRNVRKRLILNTLPLLKTDES